MQLDEQAVNQMQSQVERDLELFAKTPRYVEAFEKLKNTPTAKLVGINESHLYGLGCQLRAVDNYVNDYIAKRNVTSLFENTKRSNVRNENASLNDLATLPRLSYDLLITNMGNNPISVFAGMQPIASSKGDVFVKTLTAANSRGNTTAGQIISSPLQNPDVYTDYFAGANAPELTVATTAAVTPSAGPYTTTIAGGYVRKGSVRVVIKDNTGAVISTIYGQDNPTSLSTADIIGRGIEGTIDYTTGDVSLTFTGTVPVSATIRLLYTSNLEESGAYGKLNLGIIKVPVVAEPFVIGQEFGLFQTWEIEQMFGRLAQDDAQNDLSQAMMAEFSNKIINKMFAQVVADGLPNLTTWDYVTPVGQNDYLYRMALTLTIEQAGQKLYSRTGRARIDVIIADPYWMSIFAPLPGFEKIDMVTQGAHLFGKWNGIIFVRAPQLPKGEAICLHTGTGMFDKPAILATYMPLLFLHPNIPVPNNVLRVQGAAVSYAAADLVIPRFLTRHRITNIP